MEVKLESGEVMIMSPACRGVEIRCIRQGAMLVVSVVTREQALRIINALASAKY